MPHLRWIHGDQLKSATVPVRALEDLAITPDKVINTPVDGSAPGMPIVWRVNIPDGTANYTVTVPYKCVIVGVSAQKSTSAGGAGDTVQLQTAGGLNNISNAMSLNIGTAGGLVSATSIHPTYGQVAAGATLRLAATHATDCSCAVTIQAIRVA